MIRTRGRVLSGEGTWVKIPKFNAFSRNVNTINLKKFEVERKFNKHSEERISSKEFI